MSHKTTRGHTGDLFRKRKQWGGLVTHRLVPRCGRKEPPSQVSNRPRLLAGQRQDGLWASPGQAAGDGVRPRHRHKVHGAQQQRAHLLVLLERLAQVLQLLRQLPDLPPQHCVFLLQALILLRKTERAPSSLKTPLPPSSRPIQPAPRRLPPSHEIEIGLVNHAPSTAHIGLFTCLMTFSSCQDEGVVLCLPNQLH